MVYLAVFPKCYMDELCVTRSMSLFEWIDLAATLPVAGLELYDGFLRSLDSSYLESVRTAISAHGLQMPMMCYSPDFTIPDAAARQAEVAKQQAIMTATAALGGRFCRVLSGQRRPNVNQEQGIDWVVAAIEALLPHAEALDLTLTLENHYKDNYWTYPEFAQSSAVFCAILDRLPSPRLGVNYDPSNAWLAGEDPLTVLDRVKTRIVTMHASDRGLKPGYTLADLHAQENAVGYAAVLQHGEIGQGLNDFDAIFATLHAVGFDGWISIEDGVNGPEELRRSAEFLRAKTAQYWPRRAGIAAPK